ncbi:MAG: hypothetical protein JWQ07_3109 [Ramlibacter sp.]|nr:hypothetical protein [Ramlibacter sp.]
MSASANFRALCYLHAFDQRLPIPKGLAFESLLRTCKLDYSVLSLQRIDVFLDALRKTGKLRQDTYLDDPAAQNLLFLLAYYVGEVIARTLRSPPQWLTHDEAVALYPGSQPGGPGFENSVILAFPGLPQAKGKTYAPLVSLTSRLFGEPSDKGVLYSAGYFLPAEASAQPASQKASPPLPPQPAWHQAAGAAAPGVLALDTERPAWASDDELRVVFDSGPALLRKGRVVWGAVVKADKDLEVPGDLEGAPGEILYDPNGRVPSADLHEVAGLIRSLAGRTPDDPATANIAQYLASEGKRVFGLELPPGIVAYPLKLSSTWFDRASLPGGVLVQPVVPVLVSDEQPGVVMPLPGGSWPQALLDAWMPAAKAAAAMAPVARRAPSGVYEPPQELAHLKPVSVVEEGFIWFKGDNGVERDYVKARAAWEKGAEAGNAASLHGLGQLYEGGLGVAADLKRALEYYDRAAEKNYAPAAASAAKARTAPKPTPAPSADSDYSTLPPDETPPSGLLGRLFGRK